MSFIRTKWRLSLRNALFIVSATLPGCYKWQTLRLKKCDIFCSVHFHTCMLRLVLKKGGETSAPKSLLPKLSLFRNQPELLKNEKYIIDCDVDLKVLDLFMTRFYGAETNDKVTKENVNQLKALCDELGCSSFDYEIREVLGHEEKTTTKRELVGMRGRIDRHDILLEQLQRRVLELERQVREAAEKTVEVEKQKQKEECEQDYEESENSEDYEQPVSYGYTPPPQSVGASEYTFLKAREMRPVPTAQPEIKSPPKTEPVQSVTVLNFNKWSYLMRGVVQYLKDKFGYAPSVSSSSGAPDVAADFNTNSEFQSKDKPGQWICYNFREARVTPTSYSIRSWRGVAGYDHPKSWVLEVSNDRQIWTVVDRHVDDNALNSACVTCNFQITPVSGSFRYVRLRLIGPNHSGNYQLHIAWFEVFGTIYGENNITKPTPPQFSLRPRIILQSPLG